MATDSGIEIDGELYEHVRIWEDASPEKVICKCHTKNGKLNLFNVWEENNNIRSQMLTSGMMIEEKQGVLYYYCNDYGYNTKFDKLVFSLEKV